jgi:hypothetical protein
MLSPSLQAMRSPVTSALLAEPPDAGVDTRLAAGTACGDVVGLPARHRQALRYRGL